MKHTVVIYKSHYGTTKQYAQWIAEALDAPCFEQKEIPSADLAKYDVVVYGGGLYASGIAGVDLVVKNPVSKLVVFTVGLADPETTDYTEIISKNIPDVLREKTKVFHLRGGIDYSKLSLPHRAMMAMKKKISVDSKSEAELTAEDKAFRDTYGGIVYFNHQDSIAPLVEYVKALSAAF